jgi:DNA-binding NarL/FixJ family response regulator
MSITVFLADDHAVVRDGLRLVLEAAGDIEVVGEAANGRDAIQRVAQLCPKVVIMDLAMPELNGFEATQQIRRVCPSARVIVLSMHSTAEDIFRAMQAGANGYVLKESAGAEVVNAVCAVHAGRRYLSQKVSDTLLDYLMLQRESPETKSPIERLSPREREVLQLLVEGKSRAEIARILFLSPRTVDTYRERLMQKLGVSDFPSLIKFALQHGLTPPE